MKTLANLTAIENQLHQLLETDKPIKLNCNESPFDLPQTLKDTITSKMAELSWNRYPDFQQTDLVELLAHSVGLKNENILLGNGSSQLIQQIINCCSKFVSEVIIENPTFTLYHQICQNERLNYKEWHLNENGSFCIENFPTVSEPSIVIITSPNNPTGAVLPKNELETLLQTYPECIFLVDEAYGEFANESSIELIHKYSNLLVLKTFSKGFGLPSMRFGYVAGSKILIDLLRKHTIPFTINVFSELIVRESLTNNSFSRIIKTNQERIKNLRDFSCYELSEIADKTTFSVNTSQSNFLLLRFNDTSLLNEIKEIFAAKNITVSFPITDCIRITIGTEVEMSKVLKIIKQCVNSFKVSCQEAILNTLSVY
ncbi:aminotransferase class I/II-fold pyridoxal phosphate-dependent enzyme [Emticicia sp. W12TSBA100-4]|uniref:pyridoxal phosphate-dependent aminotransferase n=1 Tax=Emticicia sp. W12TSBA100-4 TaxID=3160965 RepID=UPI00330579CC